MRYDLLHPKALRKAVIEHLGTEQDVPGERQFRRWVAGDTPVPGWARRVIDEIVGASPQTQENPPAWAEGLADRTARKVIAALVDPEVLAALPDAIAVLEATQPSGGGSAHANGGLPDPAVPESRER